MSRSYCSELFSFHCGGNAPAPALMLRKSWQPWMSEILFRQILSIGFQDGTTALHLAARKGHNPVLSYLLNSGADATRGSIEGNTPLHEAASSGQEAACLALLKHGADLTRLNSESQTAHDIAKSKDIPRLVQLLKPPSLTRVAQVRSSWASLKS